jgi:HAE1 family hydrophobic/amphiphilic exporter-1
MNLARFSVTRPVAVTMRIAALVLLGAVCLPRLPLDLLPKVTVPTVAVMTAWPNVAPEQIEAEVTRPIEQAVSSAPHLYQVTSSSEQGSSMVRVQFQWGADIGQAAVDVMQLVERARRRFPNDPTLQTPLVYKFDPNQFPILVYGVSADMDPVKLRDLLDNRITPILEAAGGVASATVTGGLERAIIVSVDPARLRAYHLGLQDVVRRLAQENVNLPAGIARQGDTEYTIRSLGWFRSAAEIALVPVGAYNGQVIALGQVAEIRDAHPEVRMYTRLNGQPSVNVTISKQSDANTVTTTQAVKARIEQVKQLYPHLTFGLAYDQGKFIERSVNEVRDSALIGAVLAVLVLMFFLRNVRSTLVVALSIPISIVSTFGLLYMCGFTLNTMSLGGLALATGLIVDDAVVVLENIFRHIERDRLSAHDASVYGTNEIMSAVVASTMTVCVVFLPLLLIRGQAGQMFAQFALVVIFSIAVSLLDATTVVPMLASRIIRGEAHHENVADSRTQGVLERAFRRFGIWISALDSAYRRALAGAIHHRYIVIVGAAAVTLGSLLLLTQVGSELMPQTDSGDFTVNVKMPIGTALARTDAAMRRAEQAVMRLPEVDTALGAAGTTMSTRGGGRSASPHEGSVTVHLKDRRRRTTQDIMAALRRDLSGIAGAQARPSQFDLVTNMMTGGNQNIEVDIFGDDLEALSAAARDVMQRVRNIAGYENVDVNWQDAMPEIRWDVDRAKALQMGVTFSDVASTVNIATNGSIATYLQEGGYQYPIIVQVPEAARKTVPQMANLVIRPAGTPPGIPAARTQIIPRDVLLSQVARPVYDIGPSQITRLDRRRYIAVTGQPQGRSAGEIERDIGKALAGLKLPPGYYWDWGTNQKRRAEEFSGLWLAVFLAVALIYMLLASQFESFVHPLTVLASVPLSAVGVVLALFLTGRSFGLTAFIGLLMLVGIVVKNGILLVDYTIILRARGMRREEAVLTAGPTRLRPILMTTCAAVLGMLPLAIGMGKGTETQAPMATAVIGGLLTSTILTLFVVPTVYTIFDDIAAFLHLRKANAQG